MNRLRAYLGGLVLCLVPLSVAATENTLRPQLRPDTSQSETATVQVRPVARPVDTTTQHVLVRPVARPAGPQIVQVAAVVNPNIRPVARDGYAAERALFRKRKKKRGSVCGSRDIRGEEVGRVASDVRGCGIKNAVRITEVADVKLSRPAVMDCDTAQALNRWVDKSVHRAFRKLGQVTELQVAAHYACRTRNNRPGAKISEHGRGRAIDISGVVLKSGEVITVASGWSDKRTGNAMRRIHHEACGPFGTVLGPKADRYHQDHFHFDTARHRGGAYCR